MKFRAFAAAAAAMLMAAPALADVRGYTLRGDNTGLFPTDMTIFRPGVQGKALIREENPVSGTPTLVMLRLHTAFIDTLGGTSTTGIPGTTVTLDFLTWARPAGGQIGVRVGSTINWGALTGWTQTGRLVCTEYCPGGCGICAGPCIPFVGFSGTGPLPPLKASTFNLDPFTFSGDIFTAPSVEFVNLSGGAVTANANAGGTLAGFSNIVPTFGIGGLAVLGAALVYLGARAINRER